MLISDEVKIRLVNLVRKAYAEAWLEYKQNQILQAALAQHRLKTQKKELKND